MMSTRGVLRNNSMRLVVRNKAIGQTPRPGRLISPRMAIGQKSPSHCLEMAVPRADRILFADQGRLSALGFEP